MSTATTSMHELSGFHELVVLLHADVEQPIIAVQSATGERRADIRFSDFEVITEDLDALDTMSIKEWLLLRRYKITGAWNRHVQGVSPDPIEPLPENWPIGGPPPVRGISVNPLDRYRVWVEWDNGSAGELDLIPSGPFRFLADHSDFGAWQDQRKFVSVRIVGSSLTWGKGMEVCAWLNCWPGLEESLDSRTDGTVK
ncbi:MAG: DUF2442 domain-containing protein [Actinomycetia bacterium]|nr:DUF2442 domain-containing protein [Actinomycetes bacterium]